MAQLTIIALESGDATIYNKWTTGIHVDANFKDGVQGTRLLSNGGSAVVSFNKGDTAVISEPTGTTPFKAWSSTGNPLVKNVPCTLAPFSLAPFLVNATTAGDNFFSNFNRQGSLTSLPEGSFDLSNVSMVGGSFLSWFNNSGALSSLPSSFKLPHSISSCPESFCQSAFSGISKGTKPLYFHCASTDTFSAGDEYPTPRSPSAGTTVYVAEDIEPPKFLERNQLGHLWGKVKEKDNETLNRSKVHAESYTGRKIEDSLIPIKERIEELELPDPVAFSLNQNGGVVATFTKEGE